MILVWSATQKLARTFGRLTPLRSANVYPPICGGQFSLLGRQQSILTLFGLYPYAADESPSGQHSWMNPSLNNLTQKGTPEV